MRGILERTSRLGAVLASTTIVVVVFSSGGAIRIAAGWNAPEPAAAAATLEAARALHAEGDFSRAEALLFPLVSREPDDVESRLLLARALEDHCLAAPAEREYRRVLRLDPDRFEALAGLARLRLKERDQEAAIRFATAACSVRPDDGPALALLARALTRDGQYGDASECARRAVELAPADPAGHAALATILFRLGDLEGSRNELKATLACEPSNSYAHHRLGTGSGAPFDSACRSDESRLAIVTAAALLSAGRNTDAKAVLDRALESSPDDFKLHHLLAVGLTEIDISRHALSEMPEYRTLFDVLPSPEERGLSDLFPDFGSLAPRERKTIALAAAPLRRYLPRLVGGGASHRILPLELSECELPEFRYLSDQRTFDRRLYAHVRGLGGRNAVTGREYLWEAADFRYNTLSHEFAHQVHLRAFSPEEKRTVEELYDAAVREGRCLDYYARSDSSEYFAQGYEAFVSLFKHPCLSATACHTRDELRERDPRLYEFILSISDLSHETREFTAAFAERAGRLSLAMGRHRDAEAHFAHALAATAGGPGGERLATLIRSCREPKVEDDALAPAVFAAPQSGGLGD